MVSDMTSTLCVKSASFTHLQKARSLLCFDSADACKHLTCMRSRGRQALWCNTKLVSIDVFLKDQKLYYYILL